MANFDQQFIVRIILSDANNLQIDLYENKLKKLQEENVQIQVENSTLQSQSTSLLSQINSLQTANVTLETAKRRVYTFNFFL